MLPYLADLKGTVLRGLGRLGTFRGREPRAAFWTYAACMIAAVAMPGQVFAVAWMVPRILADPESASDAGGEAVIVGVGIAATVLVVLLAASVTRRLHDADRRGGWALLPAPFFGYALYGNHRNFERVGDREPLELGPLLILFATTAAYLLALAWVAWLLSRRGSPGPNRFGDPMEVAVDGTTGGS